MVKRRSSSSGFTRVDLVVLFGCVCFLGFVWIRPSMANSAARSDQPVCANNLRHIGQAFSEWGQDHGEGYGWWMSSGSPSATKSYPWHQNLWFQFFWVSNHLRSPRYLADPSDDWPNLRVATSWGTEPGGLLHVSYKNNALSYFLGIHATPLQPNSILSGDGNIRGGSAPVGCSSGINAAPVTPSNGQWPDGGHGAKGNLLFTDGRVEMTDTARLREAVGWRTNWNIHYLKPRVP